ncbi:MAG TPA: sigma 54-interacting transcriptional regulator [Niastella sp.]
MPEKILIVEDELIVAKDLEAMLEDAGYEVVGIARTVKDALEIIDRTNVQLVLLDIYLEGPQTGIDLAFHLNERNIAFVYLSANSNQRALEAAERTRPYGFMVKPFREKDVLVSLEIARYRHQNNTEAIIRQELLIQDQLALMKGQGRNPDLQLLGLITILQPYIPFDFIELGRTTVAECREHWRAFLRIGFEEYQLIDKNGLMMMAGVGEEQLRTMWESGEKQISPAYFNEPDFARKMKTDPVKKVYSGLFSVVSYMVLPLFIDHGPPYYIGFYSRSGEPYSNRMLQLLGRIQQSLTQVITALVKPETPSNITRQQPALSKTAAPLNPFPGIIGKSRPLLAALDFVRQVGIVDTSVLILGETGTGKEKIAEHIHHLSGRRDQPLIKVNCAALPVSLIESELFGHEKGAFTGAVSKRIGRFEQANGGTIFLDEIGDVPADVQVKLLRVLQEREFERVGGKNTIRVDVRVITATNKNLEKEIAEGRFRMDLYYRLNVFPVWLPPLRKRIEDIPLLVTHFINVYNTKHQKNITGISSGAIEQLMRYEWPGNIRELENSIERSVVLTSGSMIEQVYINAPYANADQPASWRIGGVKTIDEVEREHILIVLNKCNNKIYGPGGAAEMLNIPPTTLTSKMKKLGITKG